MKKSNLLIALLSVAALTSLAGCNGNTSSPSISSGSTQTSANPDEITSVVINGPKIVNVGQTATLVAGVTGDDTNSVTWSSSDDTIATVSDSGVVTGVKAGSVTITATSVINPSVSGTWSMTVSAPTSKPNSMTVTIEENDEITLDEERNIYLIEANTSFKLNYALDVENPVEAEEIYYRIAPKSSSSIVYTQYVSVDAATGECTALRAFSANTTEEYITLQVVYVLNQSEQIIGNVNIDIIDNNLEISTKISKRLAKSNEAEKTRMVSATLDRNVTGLYQVDTLAEYHLFGNGSYAEVTDRADNNSVKKYFNGLKSVNNIKTYYNLEYFPNITLISKSKFDEKTTNHLVAYDYDQNYYGLINNLITNIISSQTYYGLLTINSDQLRSEIELTDTDEKLTVAIDTNVVDYGEYKLDLELKFNSEDLLTSYSLTISNSSNGDTVTVNEKATFTYAAAKEVDDSNYEDILKLDNYYIEKDFDIKNMEGEQTDEFNFVNTPTYEKYLPQDYKPSTTTYNGNTYEVYAMSPDQSFAFAIDATTTGNTNVSLDIENIGVTLTPITSSYLDGNQVTPAQSVAEVTSYNGGVYSISNNFDNLGNALIGDTLITLTSLKGHEKSFVIRYTAYEAPSQIRLDAPTADLIDGEYYLDDISLGDTSETFMLNTTPDTLTVDYDITVTDETGAIVSDALELFLWEDGNPDEQSGYAIRGLKEGSYTFTIHIVGYENIVTDPIHIDVLPQLTEEEILNGITSENGYDYPGLTAGITSVNFRFSRDYKLTVTQINSGVTYVDEITYRIENGKIILEGGKSGVLPNDGQENATYLVLGDHITSGASGQNARAYVRYLRTDVPLTVARDFSSIRVYTGAQDDAVTSATDLVKVEDASTISYSDYAFVTDEYVASLGGRQNVYIIFHDDGTGEAYMMINGVRGAVTTFTFTATERDTYVEITNFQTDVPDGNYVIDIDSGVTIKFDYQSASYSKYFSSSNNIKIVDKGSTTGTINVSSGVIRTEKLD